MVVFSDSTSLVASKPRFKFETRSLNFLKQELPDVPGATAIAVITVDSIAPSLRKLYVRAGNLPLAPMPALPVVLLSKAAANRIFGKDPSTLPVGTSGRSVALTYKLISRARNVVAILPGSDPVLRNEYVRAPVHRLYEDGSHRLAH